MKVQSRQGAVSAPATQVKALFTINEVCVCLGMSRTNVNRLITSKKLVRVHIGKRGARITAASLSEYLATLEANAA